MSIINKLTRAIADRNGNLAKEVIHDDFKFLMHASGKTLSKQDVINWLKSGDVSEKNVQNFF
jgi:hypothetical protein